MASDDLSAISEVTAEYGVTARALRFYEDEGLIAPTRRGTARLYAPRDRARLAWILRGKRVGFSLTEIRELLDLYDLGDGRRSQRAKTLASSLDKIATLERQRQDIDAALAELRDFAGLLQAGESDDRKD